MFYLALAKSNISSLVDQMNSMCALIIVTLGLYDFKRLKDAFYQITNYNKQCCNICYLSIVGQIL